MTDLPVLPEDLRLSLCAFLEHHPILSLATAGENDGRPQVTPLFFASDDQINLYWFSDPDSRHSVNLADWEDASITIYAVTWDWANIQGVQIEGDALTVTDDDERERATALYRAKFSHDNARFAELLDHSILYALRPRWLRWLDNTRHFGYSQEYILESSL